MDQKSFSTERLVFVLIGRFAIQPISKRTKEVLRLNRATSLHRSYYEDLYGRLGLKRRTARDEHYFYLARLTFHRDPICLHYSFRPVYSNRSMRFQLILGRLYPVHRMKVFSIFISLLFSFMTFRSTLECCDLNLICQRIKYHF